MDKRNVLSAILFPDLGLKIPVLPVHPLLVTRPACLRVSWIIHPSGSHTLAPFCSFHFTLSLVLAPELLSHSYLLAPFSDLLPFTALDHPEFLVFQALTRPFHLSQAPQSHSVLGRALSWESENLCSSLGSAASC